jgi:hypothetical protein
VIIHRKKTFMHEISRAHPTLLLCRLKQRAITAANTVGEANSGFNLGTGCKLMLFAEPLGILWFRLANSTDNMLAVEYNSSKPYPKLEAGVLDWGAKLPITMNCLESVYT